MGVEYIIIIKAGVAALLGSVIGLERELARKVAGMRTHALVALASALLTSVAIDGLKPLYDLVSYDPSRIISNIIVGIGFIGAGAIMRQGSIIQGTTTAASLWAVAAIGITVGVGLFKEAIIVAIMVYAILQVVWVIENKLRKRIKYNGNNNHENGDMEE